MREIASETESGQAREKENERQRERNRERPTSARKRGREKERKKERERERKSEIEIESEQERTREKKKKRETMMLHVQYTAVPSDTQLPHASPYPSTFTTNACSPVGKRHTFWVGDCCRGIVPAVLHISK